jgi:hypothetical protein
MSRHFVKILVLVISFTLLYYGVSWAVMRCPYDDSDHEMTVLNVDPVDLGLECVVPNFHMEAMATAASPSQGDRLLPGGTHHVNDFFTLQSRSGDRGSDIWLRAVFKMSPSLASLIGLPSYLFLSVLRF